MTADSQLSFLRRTKSSSLRRHRWLFLGVAVPVLLMLLVLWRPIQRQCLAYLLLRAEAPAPEVLSEVVEKSGDPKPVLLRLWATQRLPHRRFVLSYLGRIADSKPDLFRRLESVVLEAAHDVDHEARKLALDTLVRLRHAQSRRLALEQLGDADPAARLLGLQSLRRIATANDVPLAIDLLGDPEPRVVVAAALVLRQATGQDFGLRSTQALPRFTGARTNSPSPPDLEAISQGVRRARVWWKDHQAEYPRATEFPRSPRQPARLPAPVLILEDADGRLIHLSDYRGQVTLLAFWSPDVPASPEELSALTALRRSDSGAPAVLGIYVPATPSCADEHDHGHEPKHQHHQPGEASPTPLSPAQMRVLAQQTVHDHHPGFPVLVDAKGTAGLSVAAEELPTYVLVDAQGMIRRQFAGSRAKPVLAALLAEVASTNAAHNRMR